MTRAVNWGLPNHVLRRSRLSSTIVRCQEEEGEKLGSAEVRVEFERSERKGVWAQDGWVNKVPSCSWGQEHNCSPFRITWSTSLSLSFCFFGKEERKEQQEQRKLRKL